MGNEHSINAIQKHTNVFAGNALGHASQRNKHRTTENNVNNSIEASIGKAAKGIADRASTTQTNVIAKKYENCISRWKIGAIGRARNDNTPKAQTTVTNGTATILLNGDMIANCEKVHMLKGNVKIKAEKVRENGSIAKA